MSMKFLKIEINTEIHIHGSGSILLRCQFSPDWSIESMQSQLKSQQAFFVETKKLIKMHMEGQQT